MITLLTISAAIMGALFWSDRRGYHRKVIETRKALVASWQAP